MLRLLLNQKTNRKNNHYLVYIVSNISEEMEFEVFMIRIITFLIEFLKKVDFPFLMAISQINIPKAFSYKFSKHTLLVIIAHKLLWKSSYS